jgi:hypothetical protein
MLQGEALDELALETGRPRRQLTVWRRRFLAAGEAALAGRSNRGELEVLRDARTALEAKLSELEAENRGLTTRIAALEARVGTRDSEHPYCSAAYADSLAEPGLRPQPVPGWETHVLVRAGKVGAAHATGVRPIASLDPHCDLPAGLASLRDAGIASVSLTTDPMWCPSAAALATAFDSCRPFKQHYFVDRDTSDIQFRKSHRNRINQARRVSEIVEIPLGEHLDRWLELYAHNAASREITAPLGRAQFEALARLESLRSIAVVHDGEIVTMTLWLRHADILYFHDAASSERGYAVSASYGAFAYAIESATDCRFVSLGGASDFRDERGDGLAEFKRGFANASATSYLCRAVLARPRAAERGR